MRVLVILTDAYGGRGGIALYNRNLLRALCSREPRAVVVALPRVTSSEVGALPDGLEYLLDATNSKLRFVRVFSEELLRRRYDLIICSHVNLLPFAKVAALRSRAKLVLFTYGKEAWTPGKPLSNHLLSSVGAIVSIRRRTIERLVEWSGARRVPTYILENAFDLDSYGVAPRRADLVDRFGLAGKRVLLTLGRLDEERHGVDEVLEVLPSLLQKAPDLRYLVAGSGRHEQRLQDKVRQLGLDAHVVFSGEVPEADKADYYRLGDVFVMPGSHPQLFDTYPMRFSFLEAHACGLPVVATLPEDLAAYSVQLPNIYVDPTDAAAIESGILEGLARAAHKSVPPELQSFAFDSFRRRLWTILGQISSDTALAS